MGSGMTFGANGAVPVPGRRLALALRGMRVTRAVNALAATLSSAVFVAVLLIGTAASAATIPDFGTEPVQDTSSLAGSAISDVRVGENDGFDRFVLEFEGSVGAYFVNYVDQVSEDPTGETLPVAGSAFIFVSVGGIPNQPQPPQQTIDAGLPGLVQVVGAGAGFEGVVSYGLGTAQAAGFRAFTLTDPFRLVVDVAHPDTTPTATNTSDPTEATESMSTQPAQSSPASQAPTTSVASDRSPATNWLLWLAGGLIALAVVALLVGRRLRSPR